MGRRQLPPDQRAARGQVAKRKSKAQREAEARSAAAAELAALPVGTKVEPPERLRDEKYLGALGVWRELGPELERTNRLQPVHRLTFAMFCIYIAEWWAACDDLAKNGRSQTVPTVSGGMMERDRPAVRWRAEAYAAAQEAAKHFGLTPREEYALFKDQSVVARENPGLFGSSPAASAESVDGATTIGAMGRLKASGPPEPRRVN